MSWISAVFLVALAGSAALASPQLRFLEDVRGQERIVSGWEAEEGQIPHQLSLRMVSTVGSVTACGASVIHPEWGLTAAHCTAQHVTVVVRCGAVSLTRPEYIFETTEYYNHPLYISAIASIVQPHDIALLKFGTVLQFTPRVQPIRIQRDEDKDKNYAGERLIASGWGRTWTDGNAPENLNWVYLTGESNDACRAVYGGSSIIVDSTICAGPYNETSQSTCQGDSGGPLTIYEEDGILTLVGVTSFVSGTGCHTPIPAGFIRPGHYHDWYRQVTGIDFDWVPAPPTEPPTTTEASETEATTTTESIQTTTVASEEEEEDSEDSSSESESGEDSDSSGEDSSDEASSDEDDSDEDEDEDVTTTTEASEATNEPSESTTEALDVTTEAVQTTTAASEEDSEDGDDDDDDSEDDDDDEDENEESRFRWLKWFY